MVLLTGHHLHTHPSYTAMIKDCIYQRLMVTEHPLALILGANIYR